MHVLFGGLGFMQCGVAQPSIASNGHAWAPIDRWPCMGSSYYYLKYVIITDRIGPDSSTADAE